MLFANKSRTLHKQKLVSLVLHTFVVYAVLILFAPSTFVSTSAISAIGITKALGTGSGFAATILPGLERIASGIDVTRLRKTHIFTVAAVSLSVQMANASSTIQTFATSTSTDNMPLRSLRPGVLAFRETFPEGSHIRILGWGWVTPIPRIP